MDLLNLVQLAIDISLTRDNYCEEIKKLRINLEVFCHTLKQLDDSNCPNQFLKEAEQEIQKTYEWLKNLPQEVSILDSVKFQIPYNNKVEQIKEKCNSIQQLITLSTALNVIKKSTSQIPSIPKPPLTIQPTVTQVDDIQINEKPEKYIVLSVISDEHTKTIFRKHGVNLQNKHAIHFKDNESEIVVCKISRQDYSLLKEDIQQINTISQDHAQILCRKIDRRQKYPEPKVDENNDQQDVFYSLDDNVKELSKNMIDEVKYEFYLKITGRLGVFLYRKKENITDFGKQILPDTWANRIQNTTIKLEDNDKFAILMKKPDYKVPLIAYSITYNI
ncbi:unnamed protein product (macronuclear) [Paramecium tetraurelia]|uniref:Uncharacterized protein n=1 Tax=Paramecium tetraurelia TaxID=5888 RepID=A0DMK7_PARTE|nr:uncharacterized protein GSPATT00018492001 [Paramecium tetraurelia]CAK84274.1 unnamed protein product [Paramecium tetraurelia]|eukprot:XP_001451671.1 hypothetical protein (macronuclear) [Paramecium tetraurelia strain d4-2]